mgnify:CR=1 FL=1
MTEISVIIPTLKPRDEVECLESLEGGTFSDYEVLLQDEHTATAARNAGIERAAADKLVFLDDDSRPRADYLARIAEVFEHEAAIAGRTVHPNDDIFASHLTKHYDFGPTPRYVTRFWGCNMAVHRDVFDAVGGWDERIPWGHEELELAERVLTAAPIYYDPELVVDHVYADSASDYLSKVYSQAKQQPYLWEKQGHSTRGQWLSIVGDAVDPANYVGLPLAPALLHGAGTVARTAGRIRGMFQGATAPRDRPDTEDDAQDRPNIEDDVVAPNR